MLRSQSLSFINAIKLSFSVSYSKALFTIAKFINQEDCIS